MFIPETVIIDPLTGNVTPNTGVYAKRLSEFNGSYVNNQALEDQVLQLDDPIIYQVQEYRKSCSDIFFGTTTMFPGHVGGEFYMTRGHYHINQEMSEIYYTQSGEGLLLMQSRDGEVKELEMRPGLCAFIPPNWAHRSVNIGTKNLVFVWCCNKAAGHDYAEIKDFGMRKRVVKADTGYALQDNPSYPSIPII